jgi:high-affinity nickel permease
MTSEINIIEIAGIVGALISGVNFVLVAVAKIFWKLTFMKVEDELEKLKEEHKEEKEKNTQFRHEYKGVTKSLFAHIESEVKLLSIKIDNLSRLEDSIKNLNKIVLRINDANKNKA